MSVNRGPIWNRSMKEPEVKIRVRVPLTVLGRTKKLLDKLNLKR